MGIKRVLLRFCVGIFLLVCMFDASAAQQGAAVPGYGFRDCAQCPEMKVIPAGSFVLEGGQTITVSDAFAMGKYEVTFEEWDACVASGGCGGYRPSDEGWGRGRHPVMNISWQDANQYVQWLSQKTGGHYRLPSEAEWEYAARAGLSPQHMKGDVPASANCDNCVGQWGNIQTAPVGRLEPNVFGLFDMRGNVWEWVADCADCECVTRILRGAALGNGQSIARASRRLRNSASDRSGHAGLRVAMSLDANAQAAMPQTGSLESPHTVGSLLPVSCDKAVAAEAECKPVKEIYRVLVSDKPIVIEGAFFDTDSAVLKPEGKEKLDVVVKFAAKYKDADLDITGHTDSSGSEAWNRELSAARAASVKRYLSENGVLAERISTRGVASTQPVSSNRTKEGRAKNRRVEIRSTIREEKMIRMESP